MEKQNLNLNDYATIYPNENGWKEIDRILFKKYGKNEFIEKFKTDDNGYRDQLWEIINTFHSMFFNGQTYFECAVIEFEKSLT